MNTEQNNLTDRIEIRQAMERKLGYGAVQKVADIKGVRAPIIFNAISGRRRSRRDIEILAYIASIIDQPVLGVLPDGTEIDESIIAQAN